MRTFCSDCVGFYDDAQRSTVCPHNRLPPQIEVATVITPPNTRPPIEKVWVFISRDAEGREAVCGSIVGALGMQPLMTSNPDLMPHFLQAARILQQSNTERTIHLVDFSRRREIVEW